MEEKLDDLNQLASEMLGDEAQTSEPELTVEQEAIQILENSETEPDEVEEEETTNAEAEADETTEESEADTEDGETEGEEVESESEAESENAVLTGKSGEEDYEIPNDLSVKVKVDGEEKEVKLSELMENYSGQQVWDKKFTELNSERETFEGERTAYHDNAKKFEELVNEGKAQEALDIIFESAGLDKNRFVNAYVSQLAPTISKYLELTPAEREQQEATQQSDYYKDQLEKLKHNHTVEKDSKVLREQITNVLETRKIDSARFEELQKELIQFSEQGQLAREKITPEYVGQYHEMILQDELARDVLESLKPELSKDKASFDYLISLQKNNPGISKDDLTKKAKSAFIKETSEKVVARVKKNSKATKAKKLSKTSRSKKVKQSTVETANTFDELDMNDLINELSK